MRLSFLHSFTGCCFCVWCLVRFDHILEITGNSRNCPKPKRRLGGAMCLTQMMSMCLLHYAWKPGAGWYTYIYTYIYIHIYIYIYIYIHIYMYTYICIHIYICIHCTFAFIYLCSIIYTHETYIITIFHIYIYIYTVIIYTCIYLARERERKKKNAYRSKKKLRSESETVWNSRQNISTWWKDSQVTCLLPQDFILSTALLSLGLESPGLLKDSGTSAGVKLKYQTSQAPSQTFRVKGHCPSGNIISAHLF